MIVGGHGRTLARNRGGDGASTLYSLGIALQAMDAKEAPHEEHLGSPWRGGWSGVPVARRDRPVDSRLAAAGRGAYAAPLVVVQPALAAGLLVLMLIAERMLGERAGRYEHTAVGAIVIGMVGAALTAPPRTSNRASA